MIRLAAMLLFALLVFVATAVVAGDDIESAATQYNVPSDLLRAVCTVESNLRADAVGDDGHSIGLCQIKIDTGLMLYGSRWRAAEPPEARRAAMRRLLLQPAINARLAARLLRQHLDRFGGDETLALAAYNGGPDHALIRYVLKVRAARMPKRIEGQIIRSTGRLSSDTPPAGDLPSAARNAALNKD